MFHVELSPDIMLYACPLCGSEEIGDAFLCRDFFLTKEEFKIHHCRSCHVRFTNPQPQKTSIGKYYKSDEYISHSDSRTGFVNKLYHRVRSISIRKKYKLIAGYKPKGALLDIGCGTGHLLSHFKKNGWDTKGIEPNENARNYAIKNFQLDVEEENLLNEIENRNFDVVSMWHVLEHVHNPNMRMELVCNILKDDGIAVVALPNPGAYDAKYYREWWAAWDVPRHLYHFSRKAFRNLAENTGFKIVAEHPMKFDSFYVSILSEGYRSGQKRLLPALVRGFVSNVKAMFSGEYSSIIYILRKSTEEKSPDESSRQKKEEDISEMKLRCTRPCR